MPSGIRFTAGIRATSLSVSADAVRLAVPVRSKPSRKPVAHFFIALRLVIASDNTPSASLCITAPINRGPRKKINHERKPLEKKNEIAFPYSRSARKFRLDYPAF